MRILIISYFFAPVGGVATERIRKFTKYLSEFGWTPIVLTQTVDTYQQLKQRELDKQVALDLPEELIVHRVSSPVFAPSPAMTAGTKQEKGAQKMRSFVRRIASVFLIPDPQILWTKAAVKKARQLIKAEEIKIILATGPSFTSFIIGALLNKLTDCPLIVDYRDPWALNSMFFPKSPIRRFMIRRIERWCLSRANGILFATDGFKTLYIDRYPELAVRCHVISNGFDGEALENSPRKNMASEEPIVIAYAGKMFGDQYPVKELFKAVESFVKEGNKSQFEIHMAGDISIENKKIIDAAAGLSEVIKLQGYLHKSQVERMLLESDVLLMIIGDTHPFLFGLESAKLFEYLRLRKPILALVPENGAVWKFISHHNLGLVSSPSDNEEIYNVLTALNTMIRESTNQSIPKEFDNNEINQYHRRNLTSKLADLCNSIVYKNS